MATTINPARATLPGRILLRELEARGWSQRDLAAIMGRPYQAINQIVRGVKRITPETARELAQAFGTSPELWMNLEVSYRLQLAQQEEKESEIARRSRLYSLVPVAELIRKGRIEGSDDVDELEKQLSEYLGAHSQESAHHPPVNQA
jgi:HTH-type transcriptional regulator / antitoxin HigA